MKWQLALLAFFLLGPPRARRLADGHGLLTVPSSKNGGTVATPNWNGQLHYTVASYGIIDKAFFDGDHSKTPYTRPGEFTWELARDLLPSHPETLHPCGCNAAVAVGHCAGVVYGTGFGETTDGGTVAPPTWARGSTQETAWNSWVNHAGGHVYMLCKKADFDACRDALLPPNPFHATQEQQDGYLQCVWDCFESTVLEWDDAPSDGSWSQKLQYRDDPCTYATMDPATKPGKDGHLWRETPIPDSLQVTNGNEGRCMWDVVESFSNDVAQDRFVESFGDNDVCDWGPDSHAPKDWHVYDKVKVPADIEDGEYLLSWRWDAFMADQMWTSCADVTIAPPGTPSAGMADEGCFAPTTAGPTESPAPTSDAPPPPPPTPPSGPPPTGPPPTGNPPTDTPPTGSPPTDNPPPDNPPPGPPPTGSPPTGPPPAPPSSPGCPAGYSGLQAFDFCTKYHHCSNGQVVGAVQSCAAGTLFDMDAQYCNWASLVTCEAQSTGCYSNNFKDCNHADFQYLSSCHTIWLPEGARNSCVALWGSCTNLGEGSCCPPAMCHGEGGYAQCVHA